MADGAGAGWDDRAVRLVRLDPAATIDVSRWPATVPAVEQLLAEGLELASGLTVLVGENGTGKSTLVEILAEACGLNPQGGSALAQFRTSDSEPGLGQALIVERGAGRHRWSYFLRADTMHGLYSYLEDNPGRRRERFHELSHGEGFLEILRTRVNQAGFYLMDEPDAPLSFTACLGLAGLLDDLRQAGSQVVIATHSPILAAIPGASVLELGDWGIRPARWEDLHLVGAVAAIPERPRLLLPSPACRRYRPGAPVTTDPSVPQRIGVQRITDRRPGSASSGSRTDGPGDLPPLGQRDGSGAAEHLDAHVVGARRVVGPYPVRDGRRVAPRDEVVDEPVTAAVAGVLRRVTGPEPVVDVVGERQVPAQVLPGDGPGARRIPSRARPPARPRPGSRAAASCGCGRSSAVSRDTGAFRGTLARPDRASSARARRGCGGFGGPR